MAPCYSNIGNLYLQDSPMEGRVLINALMSFHVHKLVCHAHVIPCMYKLQCMYMFLNER